jgi:predicted transcriptional regulator
MRLNVIGMNMMNKRDVGITRVSEATAYVVHDVTYDDLE